MILRSLPVALAILTVSTPLAIALGWSPVTTDDEVRVGPMLEMARLFGDEFTFEPAPPGLDVVQSVDYWTQVRSIHGRTPMGWVDWVHETYNFDVTGAPAASDSDLVDNVLRLYRALDLPVTPDVRAAIEESALALSPEVQASFGKLVGVVADAYEAQMPIAQDVVSRWPAGFDIQTPFLSYDQRDASAAHAAAVVAAVNEFRLGLPALPEVQSVHGADPPLFADPEGLVILGGLGDGTYTQSGTVKDPVLVVEPGGNDVYLNSAGGAAPVGVLAGGNLLVLSAVADLDGDDAYTYAGQPTIVQGAGLLGGVGLLLDAQGDDAYVATYTRTNAGPFRPLGQYYFDAGAQGYGYGGYGLLLDGLGNDLYRFDVASTQGRHIWALAQGFGAAGGLGISSDVAGDDLWLSNGLGLTGAGAAQAFQGLYTQGTGFYSGVGIMTDTGLGADVYHSYNNASASTPDYYAQGFGAFAGLGVLYEDGGNDDYIAVESAGVPNPIINPLLNCAYGTGSIAGYGVFIEASGNDHYYGDTISTRSAHTMNEGFGGIGAAVGVFVDGQGTDVHIMEAHGSQGSILSGRGVVELNRITQNLGLGEGGNVVGLYLDAGGLDTYVGPGRDMGVWPTGADLNLVP